LVLGSLLSLEATAAAPPATGSGACATVGVEVGVLGGFETAGTSDATISGALVGRGARTHTVSGNAGEIDRCGEQVVLIVGLLDDLLDVGVPGEGVGGSLVNVSDVDPLALKSLVVDILAAGRQALVGAGELLSGANDVHQAKTVLVSGSNECVGVLVKQLVVGETGQMPMVVALVEMERELVTGILAESGASRSPTNLAISAALVGQRGVETEHSADTRACQTMLLLQALITVGVHGVNDPRPLERAELRDQVASGSSNGANSGEEDFGHHL